MGDALYDGVLMNHVIEWLSIFSGAGLKAFRHTAAFAVFVIVDELVTLTQGMQKVDIYTNTLSHTRTYAHTHIHTHAHLLTFSCSLSLGG